MLIWILVIVGLGMLGCSTEDQSWLAADYSGRKHMGSGSNYGRFQHNAWGMWLSLYPPYLMNQFMQEAGSSGGCSVVIIVVLLAITSELSALDEDRLWLYRLFCFWADGSTIWMFELIKYHNILWLSRIGWAYRSWLQQQVCWDFFGICCLIILMMGLLNVNILNTEKQ